MFNNAWPSIYWHLFDWYMLPAGGYFGTKKANEPVHVLFSYDDRSVAVVQSGPSRAPIHGARLQARIVALDGAVQWTRDTVIDVAADSSARVIVLPEPGDSFGMTYFVDLRLSDAAGQPLSTNFYWLSKHPDVLSDSSTWYMTPVKEYADFKALRTMPAATLGASATFSRGAARGEQVARVTLTNPGHTLAFFVRLQVTGRKGEEALPVLWSDNYVSLLPGERRTVTARYAVSDLGGGAPRVIVSGWNVARTVAK
jgi:exo-1,4-beta-D-glucosaminidase